MSKQAKSKRFQSGREVFRTYIPNYVEPASRKPSKPMDLEVEATEVATTLVQNFEAKLASNYRRQRI